MLLLVKVAAMREQRLENCVGVFNRAEMSYHFIMHHKIRNWIVLIFAISATGVVVVNAAIRKSSTPKVTNGSTQVACWKGDKKAVFLLMFDDSLESHFKTVIPELKKRGLRATFYVNPGAGMWQSSKEKWEKEIPSIPNAVYANHTWSHKGIVSLENAEEEIGKANDVLLKLFPGKPRLISFGRPGVSPEQWKISDADLKTVLARHNLVERPASVTHIAMAPLKTSSEMLGLADAAISAQGMEGMVFHGVGAEWITTPVETFTALLDGLQARSDKLWITDHISAHQYETERDNATVHVLESSAHKIRLRLQTSADPRLYNLPLTLITQVPASWKKCEVVQGSHKTYVAASKGKAMFEAMPNGAPINVRPIAVTNAMKKTKAL